MDMKIRMLRSTAGSPDGIHVNNYERDKEYVMGESLARSFISIKAAEIVETEEVIETKAETVPENKAEEAAPENKAEAKKPLSKAERKKLDKLERSRNR